MTPLATQATARRTVRGRVPVMVSSSRPGRSCRRWCSTSSVRDAGQDRIPAVYEERKRSGQRPASHRGWVVAADCADGVEDRTGLGDLVGAEDPGTVPGGEGGGGQGGLEPVVLVGVEHLAEELL